LVGCILFYYIGVHVNNVLHMSSAGFSSVALRFT